MLPFSNQIYIVCLTLFIKLSKCQWGKLGHCLKMLRHCLNMPHSFCLNLPRLIFEDKHKNLRQTVRNVRITLGMHSINKLTHVLVPQLSNLEAFARDNIHYSIHCKNLFWVCKNTKVHLLFHMCLQAAKQICLLVGL